MFYYFLFTFCSVTSYSSLFYCCHYINKGKYFIRISTMQISIYFSVDFGENILTEIKYISIAYFM